MKTATLLSVRGATKRFGGLVAVNELSFDVYPGEVVGLLGPNGSGKTTTIRMLLGLVTPTAGTREVLGHPIPDAADQALHRVGALVEGPAFHPYLSGRANLARLDAADRHTDPATAKARIDAALDRVGLLAAATKRYRAYSLACVSAWPSPARCSRRATCSSSTNPPMALTHKALGRSGRWSGRSRRTARRCSCPATCSPKSSRCAPTSA